MKAIILAGGTGTKLRPLTCTRPKPMAKLLDKPVIEYILALLKKHQITEIGITTHYMSKEIMDYFGDGSNFGVSISYFTEATPLGTAGSIKKASDFLSSSFIVINGDILTDIDITEAVEYHKSNSALATLILKKTDMPLEYGVVDTDKTGKITRFIEKPNWNEIVSDTVSTGIYIFEPDIFEYIKEDTKYDFAHDLFPLLLKEKKNLYGYLSSNYWCDVGDVVSYISAQHDMILGKVSVSLGANQTTDEIYIGKNVFIAPDAKLSSPLYISDNVRIDNGAILGEGSVIESGAHIGAYASIKKSIIGANSYIGENSQLRACIVGEKNVIKESVYIFEQAIIGDMCHIGQNCIIKPSIRIWPNKIVKENSRVNTNLVWNDTHKNVLFEKATISGKVGIDITCDLAARLGACLGTFLKRGKIAVSLCGGADADMLCDAVISGIMSAGSEVYDCKTQLSPMTRSAIRFYKLDGGIHISISDSIAKIIVMDKNGCDIPSKQRHLLNQLYEREDFARAKSSEIKKTVDIQNYKTLYVQDIVRKFKDKKISSKILINTQNPFAYDIINTICKKAEIDAVISNDSINFTHESAKNFSLRVRKEEALFGAMLDFDAEELILVDKNNNILKNSEIIIANIAISILTPSVKAIVMPVSSPQILSNLAREYKKQIVYSKTDRADFMFSVAKSKDQAQFTLHFDKVAAVLQMLMFFDSSTHSMEEIFKISQKSFVTSNKLYCSPGQKGSIVKHLVDEFDDYNTDLTEGIKVWGDKGWILVVPDAVSPYVNIFSSSTNAETADELASDIIDKIEKIKHNL